MSPSLCVQNRPCFPCSPLLPQLEAGKAVLGNQETIPFVSSGVLYHLPSWTASLTHPCNVTLKCWDRRQWVYQAGLVCDLAWPVPSPAVR